MASGKNIPCGPCNVGDVTKNAWRWCTSCEEGLCEDCEQVHRRSKSSRNHKVISIEDYQKIEHVSICQFCEQHGENLEWFCKSHDEVLCVVCVPSKHKACSDVVPISANSANSRESAALSDLEETIEGTLRNVQQCIKNRETAIEEIEKQELAIKTMVLGTRKKINSLLDSLQEKLLTELNSTSHTCKSKYMIILQKLKSTEEMVTKLREQTIHMKQFSSDIQVFLGTRQVNKRIVGGIESIKEEIDDAKDYELKISIHSLIEKLYNDLEQFGEIKISESSTKLDFKDHKIDQAQIGIYIPKTRNISEIKLQLVKTFQMKSQNKIAIKGCVILPNGRLLMTNDTNKKKQLIEYSAKGEHIRDIPVSAEPYDIAVIDFNRIVVSYGYAAFIEVINSCTFQVENEIRINGQCWGVSHEDGILYVLGYSSIRVRDLSGNKRKTLKIASDEVKHITTSKDRIFYTDYNEHNVHCCRHNGEELWQLKCESVRLPFGVTVDNNHNVYVVGYSSNNLTIIQQDGKDSKTLLTELDGLDKPRAVYYDQDERTLLICSEQGKVALYKVV